MDKKNNVFHIDPIYINYRRMWKEDRWKFSGEMVKMTIKESKVGKLDSLDQYKLDTMNRIVSENDGKWNDDFDYSDGKLVKKSNKRLKR